jgi:hypothetical protein
MVFISNRILYHIETSRSDVTERVSIQRPEPTQPGYLEEMEKTGCVHLQVVDFVRAMYGEEI